jgi:hypothetical protein
LNFKMKFKVSVFYLNSNLLHYTISYKYLLF